MIMSKGGPVVVRLSYVASSTISSNRILFKWEQHYIHYIDKTVGFVPFHAQPHSGRIISPTLKIDCPQSSLVRTLIFRVKGSSFSQSISHFSFIYQSMSVDK